MSTSDIWIMENLRKLKEKLEYLQDNILASNKSPIDQIREMSDFILKMELSTSFNQIKNLSRGLEYISFERRIIIPLKGFFGKYGRKILLDETMSSEEKAREVTHRAKIDLIHLINDIKTNSYIF